MDDDQEDDKEQEEKEIENLNHETEINTTLEEQHYKRPRIGQHHVLQKIFVRRHRRNVIGCDSLGIMERAIY